MDRFKKIRISLLIAVSTLLLFLAWGMLRTCSQMELRNFHVEKPTPEMLEEYPREIQMNKATDIYIQYDIDSNDRWVRMVLPKEERNAFPNTLKEVRTESLDERKKWGLCKKYPSWWSSSLCDGSSRLFQVQVEAPAEAMLPTTAILAIPSKGELVYYFCPPHYLK